MPETAPPPPAPEPPGARPPAPAGGREETLPYFAPGAGAFRATAWEVAPGRVVTLAAAWAVALLALFLPGCDTSTSGNRTSVRPTSTVHLLTGQYTAVLGDSLIE